MKLNRQKGNNRGGKKLFCPIRHNNPECNKECAWFNKEMENCSIANISEMLAYIAALRDALEQIVKGQKNVDIGLAEDIEE